MENETWLKSLTTDRIKVLLHQNPLSSSQPEPPSISMEDLPRPPRPAAVLIPMLRDDGDWHILFTRRTNTVQDHKGQVSFPGGAAEPADRSPLNTALREAEEEIGLHMQDVRPLGYLPEMLTGTHYIITPVVGTLPWPYPLTLSTDEVIRAFTIPLGWLANPEHSEERMYVNPATGSAHPVIFFEPYEGEILWGVTARITLTLLSALHIGEKPIQE